MTKYQVYDFDPENKLILNCINYYNIITNRDLRKAYYKVISSHYRAFLNQYLFELSSMTLFEKRDLYQRNPHAKLIMDFTIDLRRLEFFLDFLNKDLKFAQLNMMLGALEDDDQRVIFTRYLSGIHQRLENREMARYFQLKDHYPDLAYNDLAFLKMSFRKLRHNIELDNDELKQLGEILIRNHAKFSKLYQAGKDIFHLKTKLLLKLYFELYTVIEFDPTLCYRFTNKCIYNNDAINDTLLYLRSNQITNIVERPNANISVFTGLSK